MIMPPVGLNSEDPHVAGFLKAHAQRGKPVAPELLTPGGWHVEDGRSGAAHPPDTADRDRGSLDQKLNHVLGLLTVPVSADMPLKEVTPSTSPLQRGRGPRFLVG
jgi:hypothetical protein